MNLFRMLNMDEAELREQVRSMVLSIEGSRPRPETPDKPKTISFMGTIILAEPQFFMRCGPCYGKRWVQL
jgi:hypothetical protein